MGNRDSSQSLLVEQRQAVVESFPMTAMEGRIYDIIVSKDNMGDKACSLQGKSFRQRPQV